MIIYPLQLTKLYHDMRGRYSAGWVCKPDIDKATPNQIPNAALVVSRWGVGCQINLLAAVEVIE